MRSLYGIDGPRRRPSPVVSSAEAVAVANEALEPVLDEVRPDRVAVELAVLSERPSVSDLWRAESAEVAERRRAAEELKALEERFDALRIELEAAFDRRVRVAVDHMQHTFDQEIEALRTLNREEAKRIRSSNDEAFVRVKVSNTRELERIRAAIDEGVARLCSVLEGQLDRVWAANDGELERIRSAGADRLAEVHDLLSHELDQIRSAQAAASPVPESDHPTVTRRWFRRTRTPVAP